MAPTDAINLNVLSGHRHIALIWTCVIISCLVLFCALLGSSYFVLNGVADSASSNAGYNMAQAILGFSEIALLAVAALALIWRVHSRDKYRDRAFRKFVEDNAWSEVREYELDKVAAILLGSGTSFYEELYGFRGKYMGHAFTCLVFQYLATDSQTRRFICLSFKLPKPYPMIIIDNKLNDRYRRLGSNLPDDIPEGVSFDLEGDFNKYYDISTTKGDERAAEQVLAPDMMAALVDLARNKVDIEIGDKDLFFIYEDNFYTERNIKALFGTADTMIDKLDKLSKTWLAANKWERQMVSKKARRARQKLVSKF